MPWFATHPTAGTLSAYRLSAPYEQSSPRRRLTGLGAALAVNVALLMVLLTLGIIPTPGKKDSNGIIVDLIPDGEHASPSPQRKAQPKQAKRQVEQAQVQKPVPKPPPITLPVQPTIAAPQYTPIIELSSADMAAGNVANLPHADSGSAGDSEAVGHAPNGEVLYAAEWARRPTNAELGGYMPKDRPDGSGLIACKTIEGNRVDDCIELGSYPPSSHLASAVRQAAWQFRVRPPRKNGRPLIGSWVRIRIDYETIGRD